MIRVFLLLLFLAGCAEGHAGFGVTAGSASAGYSYDDMGNRLTRSTSGFLPGTLDNQSFAFDPNDRLNSDTYDANGNTLFGAGFHQTQADRYDFENRLVERRSTIASITRTVNLACDGDGQRVSKTVNGATTFYLVDELNPTGYAQVLEELAVDGAQLVPFRLYAYGHDLLSQDQLFDTGTNLVWNASFYGYDGHSSTRYLTDVSGAVTDTYDYDAFGNLVAQTGTTPNLYLYSGEQFDHDLGLYYLRARYHNPQTGRFWSMDSFEGFGEDPASLHKYTYCANNPVNCSDPSGNTTLLEVGAALTLRMGASTALGALMGGLMGGADAILHGARTPEEIRDGVARGAMAGAAAGFIFGAVGMLPGPSGVLGVFLLGNIYLTAGMYGVIDDLEQGNIEGARFRAESILFGGVLTYGGLVAALTAQQSQSIVLGSRGRDSVGLGNLRPSGKPVAPGEDVLVGEAQGLQTRTTGSGRFENVQEGVPGDPATRHLWTIDQRGLNVAHETGTPAPGPRGYVVHSNLSREAYIAGEVWFTGPGEVVINSNSGRFGGTQTGGANIFQYGAAIRYWQSLGYKVTARPYGSK